MVRKTHPGWVELTLSAAVLAILTVAASSVAQITFERTYGGVAPEIGYSVQQTSDGGYILGGLTASFGAGHYDAYLIKVDSVGDTLWTRTYGDSTSNSCSSVQQTSDGGYIMTGQTGAYLSEDIYLVKTDASGDSTWGKIYGGPFPERDYGDCVRQTPDGGYIIAGIACPQSNNVADVCLMKTDNLGDTLWMKRYGGDKWDHGYSVRRTTDGGYIVTGLTPSLFLPGDPFDVCLIKTNSSGDSLWARTYGGDEEDIGLCVEQTADGGYIVAGFTHSFGAGSSDVYVIRTNNLGELLWTRTFGGAGRDGANSVQQTRDGGYIVAGFVATPAAGDHDVYLIKLDSSGDVLWTRTHGGPDNDGCHSVRQTLDGGYIILGLTYSFGSGSNDFYLIKTDEYGLVGAGRDIAVLSLDSPTDTVFTDSTSAVTATVRNFGNLTVTFDVVAAIDGYTDTVQVQDLDPGLSTQVTFQDWLVPSSDSTSYTMTVCTYVVGDIDTTNDCMEKEIFAYNPTGVEERLDRRGEFGFHLYQNKPNPFHRSTVIQYSLATQCEVTLSAYDVTGSLVDELVDGRQGPGVFRVLWSAESHADGIYFYSLMACPERSPELGEGRSRRAGDFVETRKMVLVR